MLAGRDLWKVFRVGDRTVEAVRDVSLEVPPGSFVAILGRSGSGKSSLLSLLGGLSRPTRGQVTLDGLDLASLPAARRAAKIGVMLQLHGLHPNLTALDNAMLPARLAGREAREQALEALTRLGLGHRLWALPGELSGGEQRRVALARALILQPRVVLADEPTGDLDAENEASLMESLRESCRRAGAALVLVTHNTALAAGADQVWEMADGRLHPAAAPRVGPRPTPAPAPMPRPEAGPAERPSEGRRWLVPLAALTMLAFLGDGLAERRAQQALRARQQVRAELERAALQGLRADLGEISRLSGPRYRVELVLENAADRPVFVMAPDLTASVQVGFRFLEVPLRPLEPPGLLEVGGRQVLTYELTADVPRFEPIMPGYMHVRFANAMLVSRSRAPEGHDVLQRNDRYFVYLQPEGADPGELARRNNFPNGAPLFIPMPPH